MTKAPGEVLRAALSLPAALRAAIAGALLDSLDTNVDEAAGEEWLAEITRRLAELDGGRVNRVPWSEVRARLEHEATARV
jgi:putative addiction module component (TIGR02574 family)